jgi:hypothetical protein
LSSGEKENDREEAEDVLSSIKMESDAVEVAVTKVTDNPAETAPVNTVCLPVNKPEIFSQGLSEAKLHLVKQLRCQDGTRAHGVQLSKNADIDISGGTLSHNVNVDSRHGHLLLTTGESELCATPNNDYVCNTKSAMVTQTPVISNKHNNSLVAEKDKKRRKIVGKRRGVQKEGLVQETITKFVTRFPNLRGGEEKAVLVPKGVHKKEVLGDEPEFLKVLGKLNRKRKISSGLDNEGGSGVVKPRLEK